MGEMQGSLREVEEAEALQVLGFGWEAAAGRTPFVLLGKEEER